MRLLIKRSVNSADWKNAFEFSLYLPLTETEHTVYKVDYDTTKIGSWDRLFDDYYDQLMATDRFGIGVLIAGVLAGYLIILLRGSLLGIVPRIATLFVVIIIASWLSLRRESWRRIDMRHRGQLGLFP